MTKDWKKITGILVFFILFATGTLYTSQTKNVEGSNEYDLEKAELERMHHDMSKVTVDSYLISKGISPSEFDSIGHEIVERNIEFYRTH